MTKSPFDVITNLIMTEKSALLKDQQKYAFRVSPRASKLEVADAVAKIYGVKVESVNLMNYRGKKKRSGRSPVAGRRSNWKKAIVTLSEGEIELV